MNLKKKKELAAQTLKVGKERIVFLEPRLSEIKEAITKQDIRELVKDKAIIVKDKKGRKKVERRKRKRGSGKVKKKVNKRKEEYVKLTRKLRKHVKGLLNKGEISKENAKDVRKKIRNKKYKSKAHLKSQIKRE